MSSNKAAIIKMVWKPPFLARLRFCIWQVWGLPTSPSASDTEWRFAFRAHHVSDLHDLSSRVIATMKSPSQPEDRHDVAADYVVLDGMVSFPSSDNGVGTPPFVVLMRLIKAQLKSLQGGRGSLVSSQ